MEPILRNAPNAKPSWTPRASLLAVFAAGLASGAAVMWTTQASLQLDDWAHETAVALGFIRPDAYRTAPETPESLALARELAKIEEDARRDTTATNSAQAPESPTRTAAIQGSIKSSPPRITRRVDPDYPRLAKAAHLQGQVVVTVLINEGGYPARVSAHGGNLVLQKAALDAAKQWRFLPALRNGEPVASDFKIRFEFKYA